MKCSKCQQEKLESDFYKRSGRSYHLAECKSCFKQRMSQRHQQHKDQLVLEFGGRCQRCGYDVSPRILSFHHIDPKTKSFGLAKRLSANLSVLREEAAKCLLLCPNCHAEKHSGLW